jgi:hypothetical protein
MAIVILLQPTYSRLTHVRRHFPGMFLYGAIEFQPMNDPLPYMSPNGMQMKFHEPMMLYMSMKYGATRVTTDTGKGGKRCTGVY